jgi:DNA-binding GntR family transcriptional regulator
MATPGTEGYRRLSPVSLREQARRAIRIGIVTGEIKAGQLYTIGMVAERLGVSATPVREALLDLANEGLIEVRRNRGFLVPELTDDDLDELFQLRLILEIGAVELLLGRIGPLELDQCWQLEKLIEDCAARRDLTGFLEADREFHLYLVTLVGNRRLAEMVSRLRDQTRLYGMPHLALRGLLDESASEHGRIVQALQDRDVGALRKALSRHITHTRGLWAGRPEASPGQLAAQQ